MTVLADELILEIDLVLGIYQMSEANTPGVGPALLESEYDSVPEAHCYLRYENKRVDLTRFELTGEPITQFLIEKTILPEDLSTKADVHQQYLQAEFGKNESQTLWAVREQCIAMLSEVSHDAVNI